MPELTVSLRHNKRLSDLKDSHRIVEWPNQFQGPASRAVALAIGQSSLEWCSRARSKWYNLSESCSPVAAPPNLERTWFCRHLLTGVCWVYITYVKIVQTSTFQSVNVCGGSRLFGLIAETCSTTRWWTQRPWILRSLSTCQFFRRKNRVRRESWSCSLRARKIYIETYRNRGRSWQSVLKLW